MSRGASSTISASEAQSQRTALPSAGTPSTTGSPALEPDQQHTSAATATPSPEAIAIVPPPIPDIPPDSPSTTERNQAPGILDRRKSTKPGTRGRKSPVGGGGGLGGRRGPPVKITMADMSAEMRRRDDEQEIDTFEDAPDSTPKPASAVDAPMGTGGHVNGDVPTGLAINGAEEQPQSVIEAVNGHKANHHQSGSGAGSTAGSLMDNVPGLRPPHHALAAQDGSVSPGTTIHGLSGDLVDNTPPPPASADRLRALEQRQLLDRSGASPSRPQPESFARKASSSFSGLLSRMGSMRKPARSPQGRSDGRFNTERRNTASSINSVEMHANGRSPIAAVPEETTTRPSLQDQFASVRRQEEHSLAGVDAHVGNGGDGDPTVHRTHSDADVLSSPTKATNGEPSPHLDRAMSTPNILRSPPLNPSLPPGTASGIEAGPADEPRPVNWDLWQSVVYEGPVAVRRTNADELRDAIASGIPAPIRGVVWQVLAESKSDELESVYRALKARGSEKEDRLRPVPAARSESQPITNGTHPEESLASSASSVHSNNSTPATSAMASPPLSADVNPLDVQDKLNAEKQKKDAAYLQKLEKMIKRDMGTRTSYSKYTQSAGLQDGLFGVCKAYALFDETVGYAQGINFIAMPLLFNMSEEEAFPLLVKLMNKYDLRSMFTPEMAGLHLRLYQFERLLEDLEPALYCHLRRRKVEPQLYATQWFLTLFAYRFPLQLVLRVYDLLLSEGLTAILKFGIVLMQRNRDALLQMKDMGQLSSFLKEKLFDVYIDKSPSASSLLDSGFFGSVTGGADKELYRSDEMVRDACEIDIPADLLAKYTAEWEEQTRTERERIEELENLRSTNAQLTSRVKALEDRTQQQDAEHVSIASELVNLKVQNDSLLDENEALKMQIEELKKVVDAQPAEVEAKLKQEMDRIMARNVEVQSRNRILEEEFEDMERELVAAKMAHAQARADHDTLQQRFATIQAAING